ncbi:MAG: hypothetical protein JNN33_06240 [Rhodospirillaceae bacterium]|nr:hypothetical protein [Rhodospirillaceae bacterium]
MSVWLRHLGAAALLCVLAMPATAEESMDFVLGRALFERLWVQAPSSTKAADGLGPLSNARACATCHAGGGQTAMTLEPGELPAVAALILRVGEVRDGRLAPHPLLGEQVQTSAVAGLAAEGRLVLSYDGRTVALADGTEIELRRPRFVIANDSGVPLAINWLSPRLAPDLHGIGLLERIPFERLAELADPDDLDGDGISGAVVMGTYEETDIHPGRFGWKANERDLERQTAAAFHVDLGLSTSLRPEPWGDCTPAQELCRHAPHGAAAGEVEISDEAVALIAAYLRDLPAPRPAAPSGDATRHGARLFAEIGCGACHTERQPIADAAGKTAWIAPYTDLLVHDLGDGLADLADDGSVSPAVEAREWRTAPLWGLGRRAAKGHAATLLHDGRARSILEAILWHDGEAAAARRAAAALPATDRAALIAFLESL